MQKVCDSDSRCGLACDAKSLGMWVERSAPRRAQEKPGFWYFCRSDSFACMTSTLNDDYDWMNFSATLRSNHFKNKLINIHMYMYIYTSIYTSIHIYTPSDTKLLLTKNYSKINVFEKLRISCVIPWKSLSFPEILRRQNPSKTTKINSQGTIFVIISCQRGKKKKIYIYIYTHLSSTQELWTLALSLS